MTEAPKVDVVPLDMPNMVAVKLPPKVFTTPPDIVHPETRKVETPEAMTGDVQPLDAVKLPEARLPAKPFTAALPQKAPAALAKVELPAEAPALAQVYKPQQGLPATKLPSRAFVPPVSVPQSTVPPPAADLSEAPALQAAARQAANLPGVKLPSRAFAPPSAAAAAPGRKSVAPVEPVPQLEAHPGDITMVIAGLNPANTPVSLPAASNPAQFSAGEKIRPDGASAEGTAKGIEVPDLFAHGVTDSKPDLLALNRSPLLSRLPVPMPTAPVAPAVPVAPAIPRAAATRVSNAPDPRFTGREIYMMAIQMPNLTSYSGSWLMWYAARTAREADLQPIAAPVAHRKVDPKYIASAVDEHVEGKVQLRCMIDREGLVKSVELLRGADDRLNRSAMEALSK